MMKFSSLVLILSFTWLVRSSDMGTIEEPFQMLKKEARFPRVGSNLTFHLGGLFSITNGGLATSINEKGLQRAEAMRMAIQSINEDDQLLPGVDLKYAIQASCHQLN